MKECKWDAIIVSDPKRRMKGKDEYESHLMDCSDCREVWLKTQVQKLRQDVNRLEGITA
jgi:hypothetical protein